MGLGETVEITYRSPGDKTLQPAMFMPPPAGRKAPLLVALHTWSFGYADGFEPYAKWCADNGWALIYPHFRGPNWTPEATGSELVVADLVGAVDYCVEALDIDKDRVYLMGGSGGGYNALLMAGRRPDIWAGVSAWVPILDLATWHADNVKTERHYAEHIVKSCGGTPGASPEVDDQYRRRSPSTHLANAKKLPLDINAGIHDGYTGSVPIHHTLRAFNLLADPADQLTPEQIDHFVEKQEVPPELVTPCADPLYETRQPLFRRVSGDVRVTIFEGGHDMVYNAGLHWLAQQRRGQRADHEVKAFATSRFSDAEAAVSK